MPEEPAIKLRPRKPRFVRDESKSWSSAFKGLMRIARMTSSRKSASGANTAARPRKAHKQRCAIRVTYSPNQVRGQWAAHGRYIARESANSEGVGFTAEEENVAIAAELGDWQKAGDPRMFKMIVSPEFGERLDLKRHSRDLMTRLGRELNVELEWVAVAHFNTGHPHVHVALRGVTAAGNLRIPRDVIKHSIRNHAEDLCTEQLGFRTIGDAIESGRREINALNVTGLDRELARKMSPTSAEWGSIQAPEPSGSELQRIKASQLQARLGVLGKLELARPNTGGHWNLRTDFHQKLRALQTANDRQRSRAIKVTPTLDWKTAEQSRTR
ncbi:MAG: hypothetical protein K2X03_08970 [Bryobacteraceae bacterium]|nr:hypothetical protein [Bryobacteraceae bacterium]